MSKKLQVLRMLKFGFGNDLCEHIGNLSFFSLGFIRGPQLKKLSR